MSTLDKFRNLKSAQQAAEKERQAEYKRNRLYDKQEVKAVYDAFLPFIKPFNNKKVNGLKIKLKCDAKKNSISLFIDGKLYVIFVAEKEIHYCNCSSCAEGGSEHSPDSSYELHTYTVNKKREKQKGPYFSWYQNRTTEDEFVVMFDKFLTDYKYAEDGED